MRGSGKTKDPTAHSNPYFAPSELCALGQVNITSLSLIYLICKMGLIIEPPLYGWGINKWDGACGTLSTSHQHHHSQAYDSLRCKYLQLSQDSLCPEGLLGPLTGWSGSAWKQWSVLGSNPQPKVDESWWKITQFLTSRLGQIWGPYCPILQKSLEGLIPCSWFPRSLPISTAWIGFSLPYLSSLLPHQSITAQEVPREPPSSLTQGLLLGGPNPESSQRWSITRIILCVHGDSQSKNCKVNISSYFSTGNFSHFSWMFSFLITVYISKRECLEWNILHSVGILRVLKWLLDQNLNNNNKKTLCFPYVFHFSFVWGDENSQRAERKILKV